LRILELVRQVSEVKYYYQTQQYSINYRDKYMAENTVWLSEYFKGEKIAVWAHNGHIANLEYGNTGTMGNYLSYRLGDEYATIGFLFSRGSIYRSGDANTGYSAQGKLPECDHVLCP
jgi:erythromycin esterase